MVLVVVDVVVDVVVLLADLVVVGSGAVVVVATESAIVEGAVVAKPVVPVLFGRASVPVSGVVWADSLSLSLPAHAVASAITAVPITMAFLWFLMTRSGRYPFEVSIVRRLEVIVKGFTTMLAEFSPEDEVSEQRWDLRLDSADIGLLGTGPVYGAHSRRQAP